MCPGQNGPGEIQVADLKYFWSSASAVAVFAPFAWDKILDNVGSQVDRVHREN